MNLKEFAALVAEMRDAQREYFRTRSGEVLERSKKLEKQVDHALKDINNNQPRLFDE